MTEPLFNRPDTRAPSWRWLHVLNGALLLGLWAFAILAWSGLPELVPGHIGSGGTIRWDPKHGSPWFILPVIATVLAAMVYGVAAVANTRPDSFNNPLKDELKQLPRDGQAYALAPMRGFMYGVAAWTLMLFLASQYEMYRIAHEGPGAATNPERLLYLALVTGGAIVALAIYSPTRVKRRIAEWHATHGSGSTVAAAMILAVACGPAGQRDNGEIPTVAASHADAGDSWAEVRQAGHGTIRVLYVPAGGFAYTDAQGQLTGVTIELMRMFAEWVSSEHDVNVDAEFVEETNWRTFYGRVRDAGAGVFGVGNVTITEERRSELAFSPPYLTNVAVLITRDDVREFRSEADAAAAFRGLDALAFEGTLHETRLRALRDAHVPEADVVMATTNDEIVERVAGGGFFAYIDAYNFWRAQDQGVPLRRHAVADDPAEEFGVIMPPGSDWVPLMDDFFNRDGGLRNTPQYRALLVRHLGESLTTALEDARRSAAGT